MKKDSLEEKLKAIFTNVNDWLKFAETKNAAMIAANAAASFALLALLIRDSQGFSIWFYLYLIIFIAFACCAAITALLSLIPQTALLFSIPKEAPDPENDNLLFYGHIAKYKPADYLATLNARFGTADANLSGLDLNYAQQIVMNSQIAVRKYRLFNLAVWFTITAAITPIGSTFLYIVANKKYDIWLEKWKKDRNAPISVVPKELESKLPVSNEIEPNETAPPKSKRQRTKVS